MKHIAIFASGNGSNANAIIHYFRHHPDVKIECIVCNNPKAGIINVANQHQVPYYLISRKDLYETGRVADLLNELQPDLIVLAGFLWMIPGKILQNFPNKIINIHPALLPKYGGAGMYGMRVHQAVMDAHEKESGITIHYLNEKYDDGKIIFQKSFPVEESDTTASIAEKAHQLEHEWYPKIIEQLLFS